MVLFIFHLFLLRVSLLTVLFLLVELASLVLTFFFLLDVLFLFKGWTSLLLLFLLLFLPSFPFTPLSVTSLTLNCTLSADYTFSFRSYFSPLQVMIFSSFMCCFMLIFFFPLNFFLTRIFFYFNCSLFSSTAFVLLYLLIVLHSS